jgi:hypothetical protein
MSFRHDSRGIDPNAAMVLIPEGWFTFRIKEAEEMKSGKGYDQILAKCEPVNEPDYSEATIWHYITFFPKGEKAAGISVQFRKAIGVPYGGDDVVDADEWVGKKFEGYVVADTYEGKTRNKIKMVREILEGASKPDEEVPF